MVLKERSLYSVFFQGTCLAVILFHCLTVTDQHKAGGTVKREVFFLNLEDGYFGCQVNESVDILKLFELSKLCDGTPQCFLGSDELHEDLKCTEDCTQKTGHRCLNGVCLESQCHCNDGFGGKGCEMPDENECKFRPCDIFAHCTNTMGSYFCTCFPGYEGNGYKCKDIDECQIPEYSSKCVTNSECCNLPGHYTCKCLPGYEGDGKTLCKDINECSGPEGTTKLCGPNSICENTSPGYSCTCPKGYAKVEEIANSTLGCVQIDVGTKCRSNYDCVTNAECVEGTCACRAGFKGNKAECLDIDECNPSLPFPCGINSQCINSIGGFSCECDLEHPLGDPFTVCKAYCEDVKCGPHATCTVNPTNASEAYCECEDGWTYDPSNKSAGCVDINECDKNHGKNGMCGENSSCKNTDGSFTCTCDKGFTGNAILGCTDIDECITSKEKLCGTDSLCVNLLGGYECACPTGSFPDPDPKIRCTKQIKCQTDDQCPGNGFCETFEHICICPEPNIGDLCRHPCEGVFCGPNSNCMLINEKPACVCYTGFSGSPTSFQGCADVDECTSKPCGDNSICKNTPGTFACECPFGYEPLISSNMSKPTCKAIIRHSCDTNSDCPSGEQCVLSNEQRVCSCLNGFKRDSVSGKCLDVNECLDHQEKPPCGLNAECVNLPGSYDCQCPKEYPIGNPFSLCEECNNVDCRCVHPFKLVNSTCILNTCSSKSHCSKGAECVTISGGMNYCVCPKGFSLGEDGSCIDVDECKELNPNPCGGGALCQNTQGSYNCVCRKGHQGDPFGEGCYQTPTKCKINTDCSFNEVCLNSGVCMCKPPFFVDTQDNDKCKSPCEHVSNTPGSATYHKCGINAICSLEDSPKCKCLPGYISENLEMGCHLIGTGNRTSSYCFNDRDCLTSEICDHGTCSNPCHSMICSTNAQCVFTSDGPTCKCADGFVGNPFPGGKCVPDSCSSSNPCEYPQECISGRCRERCGGINCGVGAFCVETTDQCSCLPFHVGNPLLKCEPPALPPECSPLCGTNAHCKYGPENVCVCNPGTSGNPYKVCGAQKRNCIESRCGINAECDGGDCKCKSGYVGNPYMNCEDENECKRNPCGVNAVCVNLPGGYDCRCKSEFPLGNPFDQCLEPPSNLVNCEKSTCKCETSLSCPTGYDCQKGVCKDLCKGVTCGPNSVCSSGKCVCIPGFSGQHEGSCEYKHCENDLSCTGQEICFPVAGGKRVCVDGCSKTQCGINAKCVTDNHRSSCVCQVGYEYDELKKLCIQLEDEDLHDDLSDVCSNVKCVDPNQECVNHDGKPTCQCQHGFIRSNGTSLCSLPDSICAKDDDCNKDEACVLDLLGIGKCTSVCNSKNCPNCSPVDCGPNAYCFAVSHRPICACKEGYTGNPEDRSGCFLPLTSQCQSDVDCNENEMCSTSPNRNLCKSICDSVKCGKGALCFPNNHVAECRCPQGKYSGNPYDTQNGCFPVPCVFNEDCFANQTCNRLENKCSNVCGPDTCGRNAVCIPENHSYRCVCPKGFGSLDPEFGCSKIIECKPGVCHPTAECHKTSDGVECRCKSGKVGDPYPHSLGCTTKLNEQACKIDQDCPPDSICKNQKCSITCKPGFEALTMRNDTVCTRATSKCQIDKDCQNGICVNNQCKVICDGNRDCAQGEVCMFNMCMLPCIGSLQCPNGQTCAGGYCIIGCRNNKECSLEEACINHQCTNPCNYDEGICGQNSDCRPISHSPQCFCPPGFTQSAFGGCIRNASICSATAECQRDQVCIGGLCSVSCDDNFSCAKGEQCKNNICVKVCYSDSNCQANEICIDGSCTLGCRSDLDCGNSESCISNKCRCGPGYSSGPTGCRDINECEEFPCDDSAICVNTPGSYKCICQTGVFNDNSGSMKCTPIQQCKNSTDCPTTLTCFMDLEHGGGRCADPCVEDNNGPPKCYHGAKCSVSSHEIQCLCPFNHAYNAALGCYPVECSEDSSCGNDKKCVYHRCISPCDDMTCEANSKCSVVNGAATCQCMDGFHLVGGSCEDKNECLNSPCHPTAICENTLGSFKCSCAPGMVGESLINSAGCKASEKCLLNEDCPQTAQCVDGICTSACEKYCGKNANCMTMNHTFVCSCPQNYEGDPYEECLPLKCMEPSGCGAGETCYNNECMSPCSIKGICGDNSNCEVINRQAKCDCQPGFTGDPILGCMKIITCENDDFCPLSSACHEGVCTPACTSNRDCLPVQTCANNFCRPICNYNSDCSSYQVCDGSVCKDAKSCTSTSNCKENEVCVHDSAGSLRCQPLCEDGVYNYTFRGCVPVQCKSDNDCSDDRICSNYKCNVACWLKNPCKGESICVSEHHRQNCKCPPGTMPSNILNDGINLNCTAISGIELKTDLCANKPCGAGAICENIRDSFKCFCPIGTAGDPYTHGCFVVGCKSNSDCKESDECLMSEDGSTKCSSVCVPGKCGPNADCVSENHQGSCVTKSFHCVNGTNCDIDKNYVACHGANCSPADLTCGANKECKPGTICENKKCVGLCELPDACGLNANCMVVAGEKQCTCPEFYTGKADLECVRISVPCQSSSDCNKESKCKNGICMANCALDSQCASNERCQNGSCYLTCRMDNDCFLSHICLANMCVVGCRSNEDCSSEETCQQQKCVSLCGASVCGPNSNCKVVDHKPRCTCGTGMIPNPTPLIGCVREPISCIANRDCNEGYVCNQNYCKQVCNSNTQCLKHEKCGHGMCEATCAKDSDCKAEEICEKSACTKGCRTNSNCGETQTCTNNTCVDVCAQPGVCGIGAICSVKDQQPLCTCPANLEGNPLIKCKSPIINCDEAGSCPNGLLCVDKTCKTRCLNDQTCGNGEKCIGGICKMTCSTDEQCDSGHICQGRICLKGCRNNNQCPTSQACIGRTCKDPCKGHIACGCGAECFVNSHLPNCKCPEGSIEGSNPLIMCRSVQDLCLNNKCEIGSQCENGYCIKSCLSSDECSCGQECYRGQCLENCENDDTCNKNQICRSGYCQNGCKVNNDCSLSQICSKGQCVNPCLNTVCGVNTHCKVSQHRVICVCAPGFQEVNSTCVKTTCELDTDCPASEICHEGKCQDPCIALGTCGSDADQIVERHDDCRARSCGNNAECIEVIDGHQCQCLEGFAGNPEIGCHLKQDVELDCIRNEDCVPEKSCNKGLCLNPCLQEHLCPNNSFCTTINHQPNCSEAVTIRHSEALGHQNQTKILCNVNNDCPNTTYCTQNTHKCEDPCTWNDINLPYAFEKLCNPNQICKVVNRKPKCTCKHGFILNMNFELTCPDQKPVKCENDNGCENSLSCIYGTCQDICSEHDCGDGKSCQVINHKPFCVCDSLECDTSVTLCLNDKGCSNDFSCQRFQCVNPCDQMNCPLESKCFVEEHKPICKICSEVENMNRTVDYICKELLLIGCSKNEDCASDMHCNNGTCSDPCLQSKCSQNAFCKAENHSFKCYCLEGGLEFEGNCVRRFRTDFPRPEMTVNCLADGIQVDILTGPFGNDVRENGSDFNGLLYVKGHSKDPHCRKSVQPYLETLDFEVKFGSCGLLYLDGEASFVLVIQKHPRLVTYNAQAYDIKCVYMTGEKTITLGFNVSMLTTAGTIANTGPPPTCSMRIATATGGEITSAEIGESLVLRIDVQPSSIYGGFARNCVAKTMEGDGENEYPVTDEDGCASDPSVFGDWEFEPNTQILQAHFNAFKFPSSSSIKFQCNVRVCFGKCQPVNCRGQDAFGRRRRDLYHDDSQNLLGSAGYEGQLREEVQIESNPILAIERRDDRLMDPTELPQVLKEEVCISTTSFVVSLIITALLSLVAVAVAVSCWLLAYKRRNQASSGPLPHPHDFPNPLFAVAEAEIFEPSPDYLS